MKVLMLDAVCGVESTGRICTSIAKILEQQGDVCKVAYGRRQVPAQYEKYAVRIGTKADVYLHALYARLFDAVGFGSKRATKKFMRWVEEFDPDIVHLHDLHAYQVNLPILFNYLKKRNKPVVWTFHDCWSITGHCAHFDYNGCEKWKTGCHHCHTSKIYPKSFIDRSARNYRIKKEMFTGFSNLHIVTPSKWLGKLAEQSFMGNYPVHVCPSGIDLKAFRENSNLSKEALGVQGKFVLLGVASRFGKMKGIDDIIALSQMLPQEEYAIVLVGNVDSKTQLPPEIIHIQKTHDITELCSYYSLADVFINPTLQETQGLTTLEALACGTPVVVYNSGGAAENVPPQCGAVVPRGDLNGFKRVIEQIKSGELQYSSEECKATAQKFGYEDLFRPIVELYVQLVTPGQ